MTIGLLVAAAGLSVATAAWADDAAAAAKEDYTLFNPAPDDALRDLCTDRPTKSNGPCTVDAGHWQIESDIFNATFQRTGGVTTDTYLFTNPTLKLGLTETFDAEVTVAPAEKVTTHSHGVDHTLTGVGDVFVQVKWNVIGADGGPVSVALYPYVKLPTARDGVGDGAVEEGVQIPVQFTLPAGWSLVVNGEVDALKNQNDSGRHANYVGIVCLNDPLTKTLTGSVEVWTDVDDDPSGAIRQTSFDLALAWQPKTLPNTQFDGGLNIGLNDQTPGAQVYVGVSKRF